ncbi:sphingosine-1-phosphate phosphohydrolase [Holotrichia oblita]|uniref:Sphingosine-1-phosphate phosphohydrolase n=1 Tax=Holotrichia oblita TaxID=644536 RepID=A0ACB9T2H1_HOLOL|nr:sphingosine-1-phosphate phosphohydrolase [Holotrichia oblita]
MDIIHFLKSDQLVADIQSYFGVQVKPVSKQFDELKSTKENSICQTTNNKYECVINNKFWYYLFKFGTELGDELFYSMFIPFWFWNIDGAVGRRVILVWAVVMCIGTVYHKDIVAGLALSILIMVPLVPLVDQFDNYFLTSPTGPLLCLVLSILTIIYYPSSDKWTPTRGDTTMIVSVCVGVQSGSWLNYQTGVMSSAELSPPYAIMWPSFVMIGCIVIRTVLGFLIVFATKKLQKNSFIMSYVPFSG